MASSLLVSILSAALLETAQASSLHIAQLCRGGLCEDPRFPLLDFDPEQNTCICRAHPCWNNNGVVHSCPNKEFPYLHFNYDENGTLSCPCSAIPQYDSVHVSKNLCGGGFCDSFEFPVLDWDEQEQKCLCRRHPCQDDAVIPDDTVRKTCDDPALPILHYREEKLEDGSGEPRCECGAKLEPPQSGLRGAKPLAGTASCAWRMAQPGDRRQ